MLVVFDPKERYRLIKELLKDYRNIKIVDLTNDLIVHYAASVNARYMIRGIRNPSDLEFEQRILNVNAEINPDIKTIFLIPPKEYIDISSNLIKGLLKSNNWKSVVKKYVPSLVLDALVIKVNHAK